MLYVEVRGVVKGLWQFKSRFLSSALRGSWVRTGVQPHSWVLGSPAVLDVDAEFRVSEFRTAIAIATTLESLA